MTTKVTTAMEHIRLQWLHTVTMATYSETCRSSHSLVLTTAMNYFTSEKRLGLHTLLC